MKALGMGLLSCACCVAFAGEAMPRLQVATVSRESGNVGEWEATRPRLQIAPMGKKVVPVAIAGAMLVDGEVVVITEWTPYVERPAAGGGGRIAGPAQGGCVGVGYSRCGADTLVFDVFEPDPLTGAPTDLDGSCSGPNGLPVGYRYFFGPLRNPNNPYATNDFVACPEAMGPITGIDFAWYWGAGTSRNMCIAIFMHETFNPNPCAAPDASGPLGGVILDFGDHAGPSGGTQGYYYSNIDLHNDGFGGCSNCHDLPLPADGRGAYDIRLGQYDGVSFTLDVWLGTQPMIWGDENQPVSAGFSPNPIQWDDNSPRNGVHDAPTECFNYGFGLCVDPLGACIAFRTGGTCACNPCDANCDGSVNLFDIDPFVSALSGGAGCDYCTADANGDGSLNLFDIDAFVGCVAGP